LEAINQACAFIYKSTLYRIGYWSVGIWRVVPSLFIGKGHKCLGLKERVYFFLGFVKIIANGDALLSIQIMNFIMGRYLSTPYVSAFDEIDRVNIISANWGKRHHTASCKEEFLI
jgi:hypothetical protein